MEAGDVSMMALIDRLARMEGMIVGLQNSIGQSQAQVTGFMARVERLEQQQIRLEREQISKEDLKELSLKVDGLVASEQRRSGSAAMAGWSWARLVQIMTLAIALLALLTAVSEKRAPQPASAPQSSLTQS